MAWEGDGGGAKKKEPDKNNDSKYTVGVKIKLTKEQAADLLGEIDWALAHYLEPANDVLSSPLAFVLDLAGGASVFALMAAPATPIGIIPIGITTAVVGGTRYSANLAVENTISDLQDVRYTIAMASGGWQNGVEMDLGQNYGSWGISVNGKDTVNHADFGQIHPIGALLTPKNSFTFTKVWFVAWYTFDYGK